jgi:hypothetical protein
MLQVVVPSKAQASLSVAIRVRPILKQEAVKSGKRDIIRVLDSKVVLVLDPDESKVGSRAAAGSRWEGGRARSPQGIGSHTITPSGI